jgi:DNA-binding response OmpR family regulator
MVKILSVSATEVLSTTRHMLLEQQGYTVYSALTLAEVEALDGTQKVDLALIGHGFRGPEKRKIARAVNQHFPGLPILEMCFHSPEIPGADFILSDSPTELIKAIRLMLEGRRVRGYTD